ncbi:MAG: hypothetical protein L6R35_001136 [Caloplaca aegaea]|nr:MAG: hypothetical protein L6R35_001136 [Caloplaca aegaea]
MHVFASLYSFSKEARDEVLFRLRVNTLGSEAHCEWLDSKRLNIVCTDDNTIAALFQLYTEYISAERDRAREAYEVTKLERPTETIVLTSRNQETATNQLNYQAVNLQSKDFPVTLVSYETVSKTWCFEGGLRSQLPSRLLKPSIFEAVASLTHCRIIFGAPVAVLTVKGDNDQEVEKTIKHLDNLAKSFIRALNDGEMHDQQSTTNIGSRASRPLAFQELGVVTMTKKGKGIITQPKVRTAHGGTSPSYQNRWQPPLIQRYGNQAIDFLSLDAKTLYIPSQKGPCPPLPLRKDCTKTGPVPDFGFVEDWVETTVETGHSHSFEPNKDSMAGEVVAGPGIVGTFEETQALPTKRRYRRNRKNPTASVKIRNENHGDVQLAIVPQLTLSEQATNYAQDSSHNAHKAKTEERLVHLGVHNSINVNDQFLSFTDHQNSTSLHSVGTSAQLSTTIPDLLTGDTPQSAYSIRVPTPAIHSPYLPAASSRTSNTSEDFLPTSSAPEWLIQNPTTAAVGTVKGGSFLDITEAQAARPQPISYLDAAKRGANRPTSAPRARAAVRGGIWRVPNERLQPSTEIQSRQIHRTMNKKMAKPAKSRTSPLQLEAFETATSQILQSANTFRGIIHLEVDIGRILVQAGNGAIGRTFLPDGWSSVFHDRTEHKPETEFTQRVILQVDDSGIVQILSTEYLVGAVNWHFPKRQWDARLAVKVTERIDDSYHDSIEAISRTLSIIPSVDGRTAKIFAELSNTGLTFKSVSIRRQMKFHCVMYPSNIISCSEIQCLGPTKERQRYYNAAAMTNGDHWWEITLHSTDAMNSLGCSKDLPIGAEADWNSDDIVRNTVKQLHHLARDIITQIDGIGTDETIMVATGKHEEVETQTPEEVVGFW